MIDINGAQNIVPMVRTIRKNEYDDTGNATPELYPIIVQGIAFDQVGQIWLVGRLLLKMKSLLSKTKIYNKNGKINHVKSVINTIPDKEYDIELEAVEDHILSFFPLLDVVSLCYVGWCTPEIFYKLHCNLPKVMTLQYKCCCRYQLVKSNSNSDGGSYSISYLEQHPRAKKK